jgi:hypothetical protein
MHGRPRRVRRVSGPLLLEIDVSGYPEDRTPLLSTSASRLGESGCDRRLRTRQPRQPRQRCNSSVDVAKCATVPAIARR